MRGTKAKRIRRAIHEMAEVKPTEMGFIKRMSKRFYDVVGKDGQKEKSRISVTQVVCTGRRALYKLAKKSYLRRNWLDRSRMYISRNDRRVVT